MLQVFVGFSIIGLLVVTWSIFKESDEDGWTFFRGFLMTVLGLVGYGVVKMLGG